MPSTPMGDNNLGSYDSFRERIVYDSVSFLNFYFEKEQIDLRVLNLYGKVDTKGNQIHGVWSTAMKIF